MAVIIPKQTVETKDKKTSRNTSHEYIESLPKKNYAGMRYLATKLNKN